MEARVWCLRTQPADIIGDVEVKRVASTAINLNVLSIGPERLERAGRLHRDLCLLGAEEHLDAVFAAGQQADVFGLNVLEVNQHEIGFQLVPRACGWAQSSNVKAS